jgi:hypothetical protein
MSLRTGMVIFPCVTYSGGIGRIVTVLKLKIFVYTATSPLRLSLKGERAENNHAND